MAHGPHCARSVRHDLGPNIFPSGPPTQSISTYYSPDDVFGAWSWLTFLLLFLTGETVVRESYVGQIRTMGQFHAGPWIHGSSPILPHEFRPTQRAEVHFREENNFQINLQPQPQRLHHRVHPELGPFAVVGGPGTFAFALAFFAAPPQNEGKGPGNEVLHQKYRGCH